MCRLLAKQKPCMMCTEKAPQNEVCRREKEASEAQLRQEACGQAGKDNLQGQGLANRWEGSLWSDRENAE